MSKAAKPIQQEAVESYYDWDPYTTTRTFKQYVNTLEETPLEEIQEEIDSETPCEN
jgi:hypothetical protein